MSKQKYKWIEKLGLTIHDEPVAHIKFDDLTKVCKEKNIEKLFNEYFGIQTCYIEGCYPWDVEAVFVRIFEKKLVGTQLDWD